MKKITSSILALFLFGIIFPILASAEETRVDKSKPASILRGDRQPFDQARDGLKKIGEKRDTLMKKNERKQDLKRTMTDKRETLLEASKKRRTGIRAGEIDARRTDAKNRLKDQRTKRNDISLYKERLDKATTPAGREGILKEARDKNIDLEEKLEDRKNRLGEKKKKRIEAYMTRILKRLQAAVDRLKKLGDRIDTRLEKLEEKGVDVSKARALLADADLEIESAESDLLSIREAIKSVLDGDNPKDLFRDVRTLLKEAQSSVRGAHKALVEAIRAVKASNKTGETETSDANEDGENN